MAKTPANAGTAAPTAAAPPVQVELPASAAPAPPVPATPPAAPVELAQPDLFDTAFAEAAAAAIAEIEKAPI